MLNVGWDDSSKDVTTARFTTRSLLLLTFGVGAALALIAAPTSHARLLGWLGLAVYLLLKRQKKLFWPHLCVPFVLGVFAIVLVSSTTGQAPTYFFGEPPPVTEPFNLYMHYVAEAGLFLSLMTFPLSFLGIDP
jgi:hypothetical protein